MKQRNTAPWLLGLAGVTAMIVAYVMNFAGIGIDVMELDPHTKYHFLATGSYVLVAGILLIGMARGLLAHGISFRSSLIVSAGVLVLVHIVLDAAAVAAPNVISEGWGGLALYSISPFLMVLGVMLLSR